MAQVSDYINLIPGYNRVQPIFNAWASALVAPYVAITNFCNTTLQTAFDLDVAVGVQLDIIGLWVGISRKVNVPLTNVFFTFDTANLGFDQGVWYGPGTPPETLVSLSDNAYRFLLRAKIALNHWNGQAGTANAAYNLAFAGIPVTITIADNLDMTMTVTIANSVVLSAVQKALIAQGYINMAPMGVSVSYVFT
jgi:hypothetical protein